MAQIITQHQLAHVTGQIRSWAYNGMDCVVTHEIKQPLGKRLDDSTAATNAFHMALQAPAMAMMLRGVLVDMKRRDEGVVELTAKWKQLEETVNGRIAPWWHETELLVGGPCKAPDAEHKNHLWSRAAKDQPKLSPAAVVCKRCGISRLKPKWFNTQSHQQAKLLLYKLMGLELQYDKKGKVSTDKEALQRLANRYDQHREWIIALRDAKMTAKLASTLRSAVSPDGRMRSSFNVAAADTDRWSSSKNPKGHGMNLQNIPESLRDMFLADPGQWLVYADLEQAESRIVAYMAGDEGYIAAHLGGDVHTAVCKRIWTELPWTGDPAKDKKVAETEAPFDPGHTYRFNSKRVQHGSNYRLTAQGISRLAKIPLDAARYAWTTYHNAYPRIQQWQNWGEGLVREGRPMVSPLGRRRYFYGRPWDGHTFRQAIAHGPQNLCVTVLNIGCWHVWYEMDHPYPSRGVRLSLLAQVHDAILGQLPGEPGQPEFEATLARVKQLMELAVDVTDIGGVTRRMTIPVEVLIGRNWGKRSEKNPNGMRKWTPAGEAHG